ncbi:MAG: DNA-3-methyladenine glycosylase [Verrucomicrobiota bacterium]
MTPILEDFFAQDPLACARRLIGCQFVWHGCVGRIVETEAYDAADDPACHTWPRPQRAIVGALVTARGGRRVLTNAATARNRRRARHKRSFARPAGC